MRDCQSTNLMYCSSSTPCQWTLVVEGLPNFHDLPCGRLNNQHMTPSSAFLHRLYGEAVSLRKRHLKKHAVWLMDGILQPSKSSRGGTTSYPAASSARTLDSAANGNTSISRFVASPIEIRWSEPHAVGQAGHIGISLMPRNPFRDAMAQR